MTTYFSLHNLATVAKEHPETKEWRISMTDVDMSTEGDQFGIILEYLVCKAVISTNNTRLQVFVVDEHLRYLNWEMIQQLRDHINPNDITGLNLLFEAQIIPPSDYYGDNDGYIMLTMNRYIKNALASLYRELPVDSRQNDIFKEILEASAIEADTVDSARELITHYSGKSVTLRGIWGVDDVFPIASTINIIKELKKLTETRQYNYQGYARYYMGLIELAQRDLSIQEMNCFLKYELDDTDISTTESTFAHGFRNSSINNDNNRYVIATETLIQALEEKFLERMAEERGGSVLVIEPRKITPKVRSDVNSGNYQIAIKASVTPSSW